MSTWVLLRGLTRESRHWGAFPEALRQACGDFGICAIDLPGNGRLNQQASPLDVAGMAEHCRAQLRERGLVPPFYLLAMSLGAMVAVAWAHRYPEEIAGAVLINTSLRPFSPFHRRLQPRSYLALLRLLIDHDPDHRERTILRLTSSQPERPEIVAEWAGYARQNPVSSFNAWRQLLAAASYRAPAVQPRPPLLILASTHDRLVDPHCSRVLASRWKAAFAEHPAAGHDLPLDDPGWVARQVGIWLQSLPLRAESAG